MKYSGSVLEKSIYVLFLISMIVALSYKCNYHVDEILNYGLANQNKWSLSDGKRYKPAAKPFLDYVTVSSEHRFDYSNVWLNQSKEVHPPFYYALLHTVCSFFPNRFSPWFAGVINFLFALLTLFVSRKLGRYFLDNRFLINGISLAFVLSAGILSSTTFLRMYVAAMFWVTLLTYYYIREINVNDNDNKHLFLARVSAVTLFGALTHYYCIVYAVLISTLYGFYLLREKRYKETGYFCFSMAITGIISYLIFPSMIHHIFFGYRGKEVLSNASSFSDFLYRLKDFCLIIDRQLFGYLGLLLFLLIFSLSVYCFLKYKNKSEKDFSLLFSLNKKQVLGYLFLVVPSFLYFIIISKITIGRIERYMFPIYAVVFWAVMLLLLKQINFLLPDNKSKIVTLIVLCLVTASSWINTRWNYLYLDTKVFLERAANYSKVDCICIYDARWKIFPMFLEANNYRTIQFINSKNEKLIEQEMKKNNIMKSPKIVLSLIGIPPTEREILIAKYIKKTKFNNSLKKIGSFGYGTSYVISKNKNNKPARNK